MAPWQVRFCTSFDGVSLAYVSVGAGPPLLEAGYSLNHLAHSPYNAMWRHWIDLFSKGRSYVRYDARGCGMSQRDVSDISFEALVRDLETVADASGFERFALVGHSHGAAVAIAYAVRHPERVERLVLYGAYARGPLLRGPDAQQVETVKLFRKVAQIGCQNDDPTFRDMFALRFLPDSTPEMVADHGKLWRAAYTPEVILGYMGMADQIDVRSLASRVSCPSLVLHARDDRPMPLAEGRLLASLLPGARFVTLPSRNHFIREDEPAWAQLAAEVQAFLPRPRAADDRFVSLTPRERELLEFLARGLDNHQIAAHLELSEKTVRNHVSAIFAKLGVESRAQAIVRAREAGYGVDSHA